MVVGWYPFLRPCTKVYVIDKFSTVEHDLKTLQQCSASALSSTRIVAADGQIFGRKSPISATPHVFGASVEVTTLVFIEYFGVSRVPATLIA